MKCFKSSINKTPKTPTKSILKKVSDLSTNSMGSTNISSISQKSNNIKVFTFFEIKTATKNFSQSTKIGEFGCVYMGVIKNPNDSTKTLNVAVKQLEITRLHGFKEWVTELNVIGVLEHPNVMKVVGYCAENDERGIHRLLVYEYMRNRSVEYHLSSKSKAPLSWKMRLKVAQDVARGLAFLHEEMDFQVISRDFKSSNILLDEKWNAKLSDFEMARVDPEKGLTPYSAYIMGPMGYVAPEYIETQHLNSESDVWSYGVVLYELITGRHPLDKTRPIWESDLIGWVKSCYISSKRFQRIIDPRLEGTCSLESARELATMANFCLNKNPKLRPKMSEVLKRVNKLIEVSIAEKTQEDTTHEKER